MQQQISNLSLLSYTLQKQVDAFRDVLGGMNPQAVGDAINEMMDKLSQDELYQKLRKQAGR